MSEVYGHELQTPDACGLRIGLYRYGTSLPMAYNYTDGVYEEACYPSTMYMSEHELYTLEPQKMVG